MLRDEVAGAAHRVGHRCPARREPQRIERGAEHRPHLADAREVQRAAGDVDDPLEIDDLLLACSGDGLAQPLLLAVERLSGERDGAQ